MRLGTAVLLAFASACISLPAAQNHWVATWGASPAPQLPDEAQMRAGKLEFQNQTLREIVHTSIGGDSVRVRLSNAFGKKTVAVGAVHLALGSEGAAIVAGSDRALTFGGRTGVSIPPDALVLSDPVKLNVPAGAIWRSAFFFRSRPPAQESTMPRNRLPTSGRVILAVSPRSRTPRR